MEGSNPGFPFGGDPEDLMRSLREFAEQQAETVQEAQREQFATLTLNTAVELTAAALQQVSPPGGADEQAIALRDAMRVLFPEAVALVSAARQGFMREGRARLRLGSEAPSQPDQPLAERVPGRPGGGPVSTHLLRSRRDVLDSRLVLEHQPSLELKYLYIETRGYKSRSLTSREISIKIRP